MIPWINVHIILRMMMSKNLDGVLLHDDVHGEAVQQRPDAAGGDQVVSHNLQQPIRMTQADI